MFLKPACHLLAIAAFSLAAFASDHLHPQFDQPQPVRWVSVPDLPRELMLTESVFWEPRDTASLRKLIREQSRLVPGKSVLEIGTGSGLLAICCARAGAARVVATDINPHALRCAQWNATRLGYWQIDFRLVPPEQAEAFAVIRPEEKFDVMLSNPPWENDAPKQWSDYALYDPGFQLLESILCGFRAHTNPEAKLLLAYGCVEAIRAVQKLAGELDLPVLVLDDREPEDLPPVFLPGMLLGIAAG